MESVNQGEANKFYTVTRYLYQVNQICNEKCVIDFQTKDLSAMEKECAYACLRKQMTIMKDLQKWMTLTVKLFKHNPYIQ